MSLKNKIHYSIDIGLFLTGILLLVFSKLNPEASTIRAVSGELSIIASYFLLPFIEYKKKDKYYRDFVIHLLILTVAFIVAVFSLKTYVLNQNNLVWWKEIMSAFGLLFAISYLVYLLINFIRAFYFLSTKLTSFLLNSNVNENYTSAKKTIEKVTAFIVTLTAFAASITALIASFKTLIIGQ